MKYVDVLSALPAGSQLPAFIEQLHKDARDVDLRCAETAGSTAAAIDGVSARCDLLLRDIDDALARWNAVRAGCAGAEADRAISYTSELRFAVLRMSLEFTTGSARAHLAVVGNLMHPRAPVGDLGEIINPPRDGQKALIEIVLCAIGFVDGLGNVASIAGLVKSIADIVYQESPMPEALDRVRALVALRAYVDELIAVAIPQYVAMQMLRSEEIDEHGRMVDELANDFRKNMEAVDAALRGI